MILPEATVTKTAITMDSTAISFSIRLIEWVDYDKSPEINLRGCHCLLISLNLLQINILSVKTNELNIIFRHTISCNNNSFTVTLVAQYKITHL